MKKFTSKRIILPLFIVIISLFMGIGYAKVNDIQLNLFGIAEANIPEELMIIDVNSNNDSNTIINSYDKTLLNSKIILDDSDINSNKTLEITLYNNTNSKQYFEEVKYQEGNITYDNFNIDFSINGLQEGTSIESKQNLTFTITFKYSDSYKNEISTNIPDKLDNELNSILNFYFGYFVKFYQGEGDIKPDNYFLSSNSILHEIETEIPKREGYTFMGWYDNIDYTKGQMFYDEEQNPISLNNLILENSEVTLYPGWNPITYYIKYHANNKNNGYYLEDDSIILPDEYKKLEYIETIGSQYIDTLYTPNQDTRVIFDGSISENKQTGAERFHTLYGCDNTSVRNRAFGAWFNDTSYSYNGVLQYENQASYGTNIKLNAELNRRFISDSNKNNYSWYYYNSENTIQYSNSFTYKNFSTINTLYLFNLNRYGDSHDHILDIGGFIGKFYSAKVYDNDTLVRYYVPCYRISNDEIGLYDLVNNKFYSNNGTGNFIKGPEKEEIITSSHIKYDQESKIASDNIFINRNYRIVSWNTSRIGDGISYDSEQDIINLTNEDNTIIDLYAIWEYYPQIPSDYQQLEYISMNGDQYIDTRFIPNQDTRVIFDGLISENKKTGTERFHTLYGCDNNNYKVNSFGAWFNDTQYEYNGVLQYGNQSIYGTNIKLLAELNRRFISDSNKNNYSWYYYGEDTIKYSRIFEYTNFSAINTLYLFNLNRNGSSHDNLLTLGGLIGSFYSAKIYDNDTLVRDYVPCYRLLDDVVGVYDFITNTFYENLGTGEFIKGPNK